MSGIEVATGQLTKDSPKNAKPLRSECSGLLNAILYSLTEALVKCEDVPKMRVPRGQFAGKTKPDCFLMGVEAAIAHIKHEFSESV